MSDLLDQLKRALPDRYVVERELGEGGAAIVFLAKDLKHGRYVAVKILRPEACAAIGAERFQREIEVAARLQHPNIVPVYDSGQAEGLLGFTMPFVDGQTLQERLTQVGRFALEEFVEITRDVAGALNYAHQQGVVHRDIKPANILLSGGRALVADFGIAWVSDAVGTERLTGSGRTIGTPWYTSPEQATGEQEVDHRSDVYSLGCLLYELLSGEPPYTGTTMRSIIMQHLTAEVPELSARRTDVPAHVANAIAKAMAKDPTGRFDSAAELARAIITPLSIGAITPESNASMVNSPASEQSVAVLPFTNMSADPENEYFSDGMTEEIINALAQVPNLQVAARTSSFAFKGKNTDIAVIGAKLKVATLLEGSVRKVGTKLRITAQLVKVADGYHLWSERYDRELGDVFAIQEEIARAITDTLRVKLADAQAASMVKPGTDDLQAYTLYLKGRYCWGKRTAKQLKVGIQHFERAISIDERYALAYAGLADSYSLLGWYRHLSSREAYQKVQWAAEMAVQIDGSLAEAYTSLGYAKFLYDWDWAGAESDFKQALERNPDYPTALHWYAEFLMAMGRLDEARECMDRAHALDPMSLSIGTGVGWVSYFTGRYQDAIDQYQNVIQIDPQFVILPWFLGPAYVANGMYAPAVALYNDWLAQSQRRAGLLAHLGYAHAAAGHTAAAHDTLRELHVQSESEEVPSDYFALVHIGLGNLDGAFEYLDRAFEERCWNLVYLNVEPAYAPIREDPRFVKLLKRMGLQNGT